MAEMALGTALVGGGGLLKSYGTLQEGYAEANADEYNAKVADQNAIQSRQEAAEEERRLRVQSRKVIGEERASYGASGVTSEGSPLDVLQESASTAELDALTARYSGEVKATGYKNQATLDRYAAENAKKGAKIGAAAGVLNTATSSLSVLSGIAGGGK